MAVPTNKVKFFDTIKSQVLHIRRTEPNTLGDIPRLRQLISKQHGIDVSDLPDTLLARILGAVASAPIPTHPPSPPLTCEGRVGTPDPQPPPPDGGEEDFFTVILYGDAAVPRPATARCHGTTNKIGRKILKRLKLSEEDDNTVEITWTYAKPPDGNQKTHMTRFTVVKDSTLEKSDVEFMVSRDELDSSDAEESPARRSAPNDGENLIAEQVNKVHISNKATQCSRDASCTCKLCTFNKLLDTFNHIILPDKEPQRKKHSIDANIEAAPSSKRLRGNLIRSPVAPAFVNGEGLQR